MILDYITWTASPTIINHPITIRWYGLFFAIGFWLGYEIIVRLFKHDKAPEAWAGIIFTYVVVCTIVGARLGHVFFYAWDYYSQHPMEIFKIWEGGLASHGGTLGILIGIFIYSKVVTKRSMLWSLDRLVIPTALVACLIRLGNLMNHEIFGHATDLPWGFRFIDNIYFWMGGAEPIFTMPSHPTQIYEALCYISLFGLLMWLYWKRNAGARSGFIFGLFMLWVFGTRFLIEYLKNVQESFEVDMIAKYGINMGQALSIPFIIIGAYFMIRAIIKPPCDPIIKLGKK